MSYIKKLVFVKPPFNLERSVAALKAIDNYRLMYKRTLVDLSDIAEILTRKTFEEIESDEVVARVGKDRAPKNKKQMMEWFGGEIEVINQGERTVRINGKRLAAEHVVTIAELSRFGQRDLVFGEVSSLDGNPTSVIVGPIPPVIKMYMPIEYECMLADSTDVHPIKEVVERWNFDGVPLVLDEGF